MEYVIDVLKRERAEAEARLAAIQDEQRQLRARVRELDDALARLGDTSPTRSSRPGTLQDRVAALVAESSNGTTALELAKRLTEEGRETANTTVSSILSRLRQAGRVHKNGAYWFAGSTENDERNEENPDDSGSVGGVTSSEGSFDDDIPF